MNPNNLPVAADEPYSRYMNDDNDSCGISERGQVLALRVTSRQGKMAFAYHGYDGHDEDADTDNPEWFTVYFRGTHGWGEKKPQAMWEVKVRGKRLESIIRQVSTGKRTTLKEGGSPDGDNKPYVSEITIKPFITDHLDDLER